MGVQVSGFLSSGLIQSHAWSNFTAACKVAKDLCGAKSHIFEKFETLCVQWYHFQLKNPIRNIFNLIFKTREYCPVLIDAWCFGAVKVKIIDIYNPSFRSDKISEQYGNGTHFKGFYT